MKSTANYGNLRNDWHAIFCGHGMDTTFIIDATAEKLLQLKHTVAVAESVTAGMLQSAFASATNAMRFFQGGITAYNIGQKCRHLLIEPVHAQEVNCVSAKIAQQMAVGACSMFRSDWGIGITGYASPVPESDQKTFAWFAIARGEKIIETLMLELPGEDPELVRLWYVQKTMETFVQALSRAR